MLSVIRAAYPQSWNGLSRHMAAEVVSLWESMFADDSAENVGNAVKAFIATDTGGFPPTVGQIREQMQKLASPDSMSETEAWGLVSRACRNSGYHSEEEFEKLPANVRAAVGSAEQLRQWALADASELETVIASNFMRSYRTKENRRIERERLPERMQNLIGASALKMIE